MSLLFLSVKVVVLASYTLDLLDNFSYEVGRMVSMYYLALGLKKNYYELLAGDEVLCWPTYVNL